MDRDGLARWDGRAAPVVTALDDVGAPLPASFRGYRAPERTVDLPGDGSAAQPVLVVLSHLHPARQGRGPNARGTVVSVERADPPPGRQAAPVR
jgi:hypothetical protein